MKLGLQVGSYIFIDIIFTKLEFQHQKEINIIEQLQNLYSIRTIMSSPVLLFLGAGANVGLSVIRKFTAEGWNVAAVARNPKPELQGSASLVISADFTKPESIAGIFKRVETELGVPSAVVYNGMCCEIF